MSHTSHDKMRELVATIRNVESSYGRPIGILVDLQGPKLRLGAFAEGSTQLKNGQSFVLDSDKTPGDNSRVQLPHPEILAALRPGHALLLDDGKVRLIAEETSPERAVTRVVIGGKMSDRKGVSLPDTDLPVSAMTPKDRADLEAALVTGVDWIALSFVQRAEDVLEAKRMIRGRAAVMAKIEKPQAIDRLGEIIEASDALMVARGDLGVELPLERVPSLQKQMTRMARRAGKPVVVATQMLESMIQSPVPTRAEVSDVATAVYEGADAIMLSAESAAGKFPVEAVSTMNRIGEEVERDPTYRSVLTAQRPEPENTVGDAIADAARQIAETLELSAIICWTSSGSTAIRVARERPKPPVVAITPNLATGRKLSVVWGVHCVVAEDAHDQDDMVDRAGSHCFPRRFCQGRPARDHRRRRAARYRRHHQHGAHRQCRFRRHRGLNAAAIRILYMRGLQPSRVPDTPDGKPSRHETDAAHHQDLPSPNLAAAARERHASHNCQGAGQGTGQGGCAGHQRCKLRISRPLGCRQVEQDSAGRYPEIRRDHRRLCAGPACGPTVPYNLRLRGA